MDKCHYCSNTIDNLNKEYDELYLNYINEINLSDKIYKKLMFNQCIKYIVIIRKLMDDTYEEFINHREHFCEDCTIDDYIVNSKNLLDCIKSYENTEELYNCLGFPN